MRFYSTENHLKLVDAREAVFRGIASNSNGGTPSGLWMPEKIPALPHSFFTDLMEMSLPEIGFHVLQHYFSDVLSDNELSAICHDAFNFPIPLVEVEKDCFALELFHGPTLAFKDVAARFMARLLSHLAEKEVTVLVATSGDTGSAVANGFHLVPGIFVVVLYPSGKVSEIQEKQLTTVGDNVIAIEVDGTFDDCQALVKRALSDGELLSRRTLTTANSINIARLLPQTIYYFHMWKMIQKQIREKGLPQDLEMIVSVPSGNFGNLTAGLIAVKMGLPIDKFVAANNVNNAVAKYLQTGFFEAQETLRTISNAMDVGVPSNFVRMLDLFGLKTGKNHAASWNSAWRVMSKYCSGQFYTDEETKTAIRKVARERGYVMDPHGAIGYLGLKTVRPQAQKPALSVFLETAHPVKFLDVVQPLVDQKITIPERLQSALNKEKEAVFIANDYKDFRTFLMEG